MNDAPAEVATVEVSASHPRFAVPMYMGTHLEVEIDGEVSEFPWGRHSIDVTPGRHEIGVTYRGFNNHGIPSWIWVEVEAGATAHVTYVAPKFGGQEGMIECDRAIPEPDDLPQDLSDLSDAQLIEEWKSLNEAGGGRLERFLLRKMRAELDEEMRRRGLAPQSIGFEQ